MSLAGGGPAPRGRGCDHRAAAQVQLGLNGHHLPHRSRVVREVQAEVIYLGKSVWVKPDATFWKNIAASGGSDARLGVSLLSGKWLKDSAGDKSGLGSLVAVCSLSSLFGQATPASDQLVKGTLTTLNGQAVLPIKDVTHQGTAYVTDTANPELLRLTSAGTSGGTFSFSDFGAPATITPPPASEVIRSCGWSSAG